jgi:hypothetical protein
VNQGFLKRGVGQFENHGSHTRESGYPEDLSSCIPAYAGRTAKKKEISKTKLTHYPQNACHGKKGHDIL